MRRTERDERPLPLPDAPTTASIYCLAAMVADEASHAGFREFAKAIEAALGGFLAVLPPEQQENALRLSYEIALGGGNDGDDDARPRLRLVYSR